MWLSAALNNHEFTSMPFITDPPFCPTGKARTASRVLHVKERMERPDRARAGHPRRLRGKRGSRFGDFGEGRV